MHSLSISLLPKRIQSMLPDSMKDQSFANRLNAGLISKSGFEKMIRTVVNVAGSVFATWLSVQAFEIAKMAVLNLYPPSQSSHISPHFEIANLTAILYPNVPLQSTQIPTQPSPIIDLPRLKNGLNYGVSGGVGLIIPLLIFLRLARYVTPPGT